MKLRRTLATVRMIADGHEGVKEAGCMDPLLVSVEEAAALLGLGRADFYARFLATGRIESLKIGRRRLVPREALERFVTEERARQAVTPGA